mgnify:CR=1 FL=1
MEKGRRRGAIMYGFFRPRTRSRIAPWSGLKADEQGPRVKTETEKANTLWHEPKMVAARREVKYYAACLL